ncbi:TPA: hypothetical protein ACV4T7_004424 [Burkholderia ambifaria]
MNIFSIRAISTILRAVPILGACWLGTCAAQATETVGPASTVTATERGSSQGSGSALNLIYGQLVLIDSHLLQLISLEHQRAFMQAIDSKPSDRGTTAALTGAPPTFCEQRADRAHRSECESALRELQRKLQEFEQTLMPRGQ